MPARCYESLEPRFAARVRKFLGRTANANTRNCANAGSIWLSEDPRAVDTRRLGCGQRPGVPTLQRRGLNPVKTARSAQTNRRHSAAGKVPAHRRESGMGLDFVSDQLIDGRRFRALTIVDIYTRESLAIEVGSALKGEDVVRILNFLKAKRGAPKFLFCDNVLTEKSRAIRWRHLACHSFFLPS